MTADEALTHGDPLCTVVGAPGSGKSSLLRHHLHTMIGRLDDGAEATEVPVLLPAAELADGPRLADALARYTNRELTPYGLSQDLERGFFAGRPRPGAVWLVLLDGLDEVVDTEGRLKILDTVATALTDAHELYRFVVTSRPLPDSELNRLGRHVPRYDLQPFTPQDLSVFAGSWFAAQELTDPARVTQLFLSALKRVGIADLARTPLMATMVCQLFADRPDEPLPASRGAIYRRFADLLQARQYQYTPEKQAARALETYGRAARKQARKIIADLPRLVRCLAHQRSSGNTDSALRILAWHPNVQRPEAVPRSEWEEFLTSCLRGSGVLTPHAGDFVFLHQTFLEYFAACHATREESLAETRTWLRYEMTELPPDRGLGLGGRPPAGGRTVWSAPPFESSYLGFVIDLAYEDPEVVQILMRWATDALDGCESIAQQVRLGTGIPTRVTDAAAVTLAALTRDDTLEHHNRVRAVSALVELGGQRAENLLYELSLDSALDDYIRFFRAALGLAKINEQRAADLLDALEQDDTLDNDYRNWAYDHRCWLTNHTPEQFID
ncbi:NACHT domain-containing protein [Streptomyces sp. NPDC056178]|uniref:NACHT domain-containing protein n=1 Tax=Streptomyces sp. NPDC056178 TaxID=3345735 RepID=UPI0035D8B5C3